MRMQGILALAATVIAFGQTGPVRAQALPPMYGAPAYEAQGAYPPPPVVPRYGHVPAVVVDDDALLPREIVGILRSTGYEPLGLPVRHGRFYVVTAIHPNGNDGRVTMDAISGRFVRFVPASEIRDIDDGVATYAPPPGSAPARMPPPGGLRPPGSLPKVASRSPGSIPVPKPAPPARPAPGATTASPQPERTAETNQAVSKPAETRPAETRAAETKPAETRPTLQLLPTQPTPPVQSLE